MESVGGKQFHSIHQTHIFMDHIAIQGGWQRRREFLLITYIALLYQQYFDFSSCWTGYKLGTSHIMSKSLEQACLSKNGGKQYYLQFHIKPWMRRLPWFRRYTAQHPKRKNVKESLRTPSLYTALELLHKRLREMGLMWSDTSNSLEPLPAKEITTLSEEGEYFQALEQLSSLSDSQLIPTMDPAHPDAPSLPRDIEVEVFMEAMELGTNGPDQPSKR